MRIIVLFLICAVIIGMAVVFAQRNAETVIMRKDKAIVTCKAKHVWSCGATLVCSDGTTMHCATNYEVVR
jgi:hypothetical protein